MTGILPALSRATQPPTQAEWREHLRRQTAPYADLRDGDPMKLSRRRAALQPLAPPKRWWQRLLEYLAERLLPGWWILPLAILGLVAWGAIFVLAYRLLLRSVL